MCNLWCAMGTCNFWIGAAFSAAVIIFFSVVIWISSKCRGGLKEIVVSDEGGSFTISSRAMRQFVRGIVGNIEGIVLKGVCFVKRDKRCHVKISIAAKPQADLVAIKDRLRKEILEETRTKLGLGDLIEIVDINVVHLPSVDEMTEAVGEDSAQQAASDE